MRNTPFFARSITLMRVHGAAVAFRALLLLLFQLAHVVFSAATVRVVVQAPVSKQSRQV